MGDACLELFRSSVQTAANAHAAGQPAARDDFFAGLARAVIDSGPNWMVIHSRWVTPVDPKEMHSQGDARSVRITLTLAPAPDPVAPTDPRAAATRTIDVYGCFSGPKVVVRLAPCT
jgi:hypothetical protein